MFLFSLTGIQTHIPISTTMILLMVRQNWINNLRTLEFLLHCLKLKPGKGLKATAVGEWRGRWGRVSRYALLFSLLKEFTPSSFPAFLELSQNSFFLTNMSYSCSFLFLYQYLMYFHLIKLFFSFLSISTLLEYLPLTHKNLASSLHLSLQIPSKSYPFLHSHLSISVF